MAAGRILLAGLGLVVPELFQGAHTGNLQLPGNGLCNEPGLVVAPLAAAFCADGHPGQHVKLHFAAQQHGGNQSAVGLCVLLHPAEFEAVDGFDHRALIGINRPALPVEFPPFDAAVEIRKAVPAFPAQVDLAALQESAAKDALGRIDQIQKPVQKPHDIRSTRRRRSPL